MKKITLLIITIFTSYYLIIADSTGAGFTSGSPGETSCSSGGCHGKGNGSYSTGGLNDNAGPGKIYMTTSPALVNGKYSPNTRYKVSVVVKETGRSLFGFCSEFIDNSANTNLKTNDNAGKIIITDRAHTKKVQYFGTGRISVTHQPYGNTTPDSTIFTYDWIAPATGTGIVNFYASGNAANDNSVDDAGDNIYTLHQQIAEATSSEKDILSFSLSGYNTLGIISGSNITAVLPNGTSLSSLTPVFTLSQGATAKVGAVSQTSGTTSNNFTSAVTYTITAADGSTKNYSVNISAAAANASNAKSITAFSFQSQTGIPSAATGNISGSAINISIPFLCDYTNLIPTFTLSSKATAVINNIAQISGTTANDYTSTVTYTIIAEDGTKQNYTVKTNWVSPSTANAITAFSFQSQKYISSAVTGTITGTNISITVPYGTPVDSLQASFTLSAGAVAFVTSAYYSGIPQQSGKTYNDFTDTVKYDIRSQNGKIQTFNVLVSFGAKPSAAIATSGSLNSFSAVVGAPSSVQNFTVSGTNLSNTLDITAPTNFEVSTNSTSGFGNSLSLNASNGTISSTTIYVRFNPSSAGSFNGNIACTSTGATTKNISVSGTATASQSASIIATGSLSAFSATVGTPSSAQSFTVSGTILTANIIVTAPSQFEVSLNSSSGFGSSISLTPSSGSVSSTTIYVRMNPSTAGSYNGNITCASTGANTQNVSVTGTANAIQPANIIAAGSLSAFSTIVGTPSSVQAFTVSGTNLTTNIIITAPTNFEISQNSTTGFSSSLSLTPSSGTISSTTIYVRMNPAAVGNYNGNITCASTLATTQNIAVSGTATVNQTPAITIAGSIIPFSSIVGTPSTVQAFSVSGSLLTTNITITAPVNFEVSQSATTGFGTSLSLTPSSGTVASTIIYVRMNASTIGTFNGSVACTSTGANTQNVTVSGTTTANNGMTNIKADDILLYPNPVHDELYISLSNKLGDNITVQLIDVTGSIIISEKVSVNNIQEGLVRISVKDLEKGIYIIKVFSNNYMLSKKIIKD